MAKTNWQTNDTVMPTDANDWGGAVAKADSALPASDYTRAPASVVTGGTGAALTAIASGVTPADRQAVMLQLHADIQDNAKLAVNGGTAYPLYTLDGKTVTTGAKSGSYLLVIYNAAAGRWYIANAIPYSVAPTIISDWDLYVPTLDDGVQWARGGSGAAHSPGGGGVLHTMGRWLFAPGGDFMLIGFHASGDVYTRIYKNDSWQPFVKLATPADITTAVSAINTEKYGPVYICNGGPYDTANIQKVINDFFSTGTAQSMSLKITGTLGFATSPSYWFNLTSTRDATVTIDFSDCKINVTAPVIGFMQITGAANVNVKGLVMGGYASATNWGVGINIDTTGLVTFTDCPLITGAHAVVLSANARRTVFTRCNIYGQYNASALYDQSTGGGTHVFNACKFGGAGGSGVPNLITTTSGSLTKHRYYGCIMDTSNFMPVSLGGDAHVLLHGCRVQNGRVYLPASFTGSLTVDSSVIYNTDSALEVDSASQYAEIRLQNSKFSGTNGQDVHQSTATGTVFWYIAGNSFKNGAIVVDGSNALTYKTPTPNIYFPQYANWFNRNITY